MSSGGRERTDYWTARGRDWPSVRQFNVFLENRVGMLLELVRKFEVANNRIVALSVDDSVDYAIIRLVLRDPDRARETFNLANIPYIESDLLVVQLPPDPHPLVDICKALLQAEINIHYAYPLMLAPERPALALHVDNHETAVAILRQQGFTILTEADLGD
ncbi:MAG: acetolactate synthase [Gemmatales bacterium]|nr:acetolactate synthase [Gemmatales bacterium]MCS7159745.1 acetolactate synthase [Gemmatales bacterium]MDW8174943.1 acetolactate synthase [Gemmatales bacterium]MDW8221337.1 acetolactate synthase [Gemmatales bacterium]